MSGYDVDTTCLRGFTGQLLGNRDSGVHVIRDYGNTHLRNYDRISGLLEPAQWASELLAGAFTDTLMPERAAVLTITAGELTETANTYDTTDRAAALQLTAAAPGAGTGSGGDGGGGDAGSGDDQGGTGGGPAAPPGTPVVPGLTGGASVSPKPPNDQHLTQDAQERIESLIGPVTEIVKKITGYDILAEWVPVILGDWGALYRLADAWQECRHSLVAIADDLAAGTDVVTAHWPTGEASAAFRDHMDVRVVEGFTVYADWTMAVKEFYESAAVSYEAIITNGLWLLEYYGVRFKTVVRKIAKAINEVTLNPRTWWELIEEVVGIVEDYIQFFKSTVTAFETCVNQLVQMVQLAVAEAKAILSYIEWKANGG